MFYRRVCTVEIRFLYDSDITYKKWQDYNSSWVKRLILPPKTKTSVFGNHFLQKCSRGVWGVVGTRLRAESEIKCKSWRRTATGQCQRVSWISGGDRLRNGRNGTLPLVGAGMPLACIYTACSTCTVKLMVHYRRPLCSNRASNALRRR